VYFPRPYLEDFDRSAKERNLESAMLLAITRQESSFKVDARSPANAWGLMQLTPPTAKRLSKSAGFEDAMSIALPEDLNKPSVNTKIASTFVRELLDTYSGARPATFAAYNAGTQAVEHWVSRRMIEDPLIFIELIPYQETRDYVKSVWRNELVYRWLEEKAANVSKN
jgi:soluble lytic murein transglycosylase